MYKLGKSVEVDGRNVLFFLILVPSQIKRSINSY